MTKGFEEIFADKRTAYKNVTTDEAAALPQSQNADLAGVILGLYAGAKAKGVPARPGDFILVENTKGEEKILVTARGGRNDRNFSQLMDDAGVVFGRVEDSGTVSFPCRNGDFVVRVGEAACDRAVRERLNTVVENATGVSSIGGL